jgi:DNA-binding GntR family transcriptional regulator
LPREPLAGGAEPPIIDRRPLDQRAAAIIRQRIISGIFPPGSRLVETKLSNELNLSRGTIRSALTGLGHEGLVTQTAYTKWEVAVFSADDAWELFTLRSTLEGLAAHLAAERISSAECSRLWGAFERLEAAAASGESALLTSADFLLHKTTIEIARHRRLHEQYRLLEQQIRILITSSNALVPTLADVVAQHRPLVEALTSSRAEEAERLAREHNLGEMRVLVAHLSQEGRAGGAAENESIRSALRLADPHIGPDATRSN